MSRSASLGLAHFLHVTRLGWRCTSVNLQWTARSHQVGATKLTETEPDVLVKFSVPTNPHGWTKLMLLRKIMYCVAPLDSEGITIYSTNLYQGVSIPIVGNQSIARFTCGRLSAMCGGAFSCHRKCFRSRFAKVNSRTNLSTCSVYW